MNQALNPAAAWPAPIGKTEAFRIALPPLAKTAGNLVVPQ